MTEGMTVAAREETRAEFHERRRHGIGGSEIAALFGLSPYKTARDVWAEKRGLVAPEELDTPHIRRGNRQEPIALHVLVEREGGHVVRNPDLASLYPEKPHLVGTPDAVWTMPNGEAVLAEVKCPSIGAFRKMQREGLSYAYILQLQFYLGVYGFERGQWVIFSAEQDEVVTFPVLYDADLFATIQARVDEVWACVLSGEEPREIEPEQPTAEVETVGEVVKRRDAEWQTAAAALREARDLKAQAEELEKGAKETLRTLAGGRGCFEGGALRLYISEQAGRKTFDPKALAAAQPLDFEKTAKLVAGAMAGAILATGQSVSAERTKVLDEEAAKMLRENALLDLDQFNKVGKPSETFRPYFLGGE